MRQHNCCVCVLYHYQLLVVVISSGAQPSAKINLELKISLWVQIYFYISD